MTSLPIILLNGFSPVIKTHDKVIVGQIIATLSSQDEEIVNIPKELSVNKSQAKKLLKKIPGDAINIGDTIAVKKSFLGGSTVLRSRVEGTVTRYERDSGNLIIKKSITTVSKNIVSPVDGIVTVCNNKEIQIDTDKNVLVGQKASGISEKGEVLILETDDPYHINSEAIGKIIVGDKFSREMLLKGIGIGVAGIVGRHISDSDIEHIQKKKFDTPVMEIDEDSMNKIKQWNTKTIFLNPEAKSIIFLSL